MVEFSADDYVRDVLDGTIPACKQVIQACQRYIDDLDTAESRGFHFDEMEARMAVSFFYILRHWKGEWAGQRLHLEGWQQFIIWNLFGWKRLDDDTRRFRTAYVEVSRKNGKTTLASGIGLKLLVADNEPGAEIYSAATKRSQAKISHTDAIEMVKRSHRLKKELAIFRDNISANGSGSKFEPLGRDADTLDGLNVHGAICDEVHAWKGRQMWDILDTATGSRRQSLMVAITTAGYDRFSFCYEQHDYTEKVLSGVIQDDTHFGIIYTLDPGDDYEDESTWIKANPNLGVSKKIEDLRRKLKKALNMPAALNAFLMKELNVWTQSRSRWMGPDLWRQCDLGTFRMADLEGKPCYGGLDLSTSLDLTALALVFPPWDSVMVYRVLMRFWIPEDNMVERVKRDRVPYDAWERRGLIETTEGNVVDYGWILNRVEEDLEFYDIQEIAFDRWGSSKISIELQDMGLTVIPFGQGFASMTSPMKELERMVRSQELDHGGHEVLTWNIDNLVARSDASGNIKPDKQHSIERIDGAVALIMALDRAIRQDVVQPSVYADRGIRTLG